MGIGSAEATGSGGGRGGARVLEDIVSSFLGPLRSQERIHASYLQEAAQFLNSLDVIRDGQPEGPAEIHSEGGMDTHLRPRIDLLKCTDSQTSFQSAWPSST